MRVDNLIIFLLTAVVTLLVCEYMHAYQIQALRAQANKTYCEGEVTYPELIGGL